MPVGTQGTVKGLLPDAVAATGAAIIHANTDHALPRPGPARVAQVGGLNQWTRGQGALLPATRL